MEKRELIAMLMESPFYFDLRLRERLVLVQQSQQRISRSINKAAQADLEEKAGKGSLDGAAGADTAEVAIMAGFKPR